MSAANTNHWTLIGVQFALRSGIALRTRYIYIYTVWAEFRMFRRTRKIARKVTISFVMYVCPSVRMEQLGSHQLEINEICHLNRFRTSVEKGVGSFMTITRSVLLWVINTSVKNCRGIQNTHFLFNNFSRKSFRLWDIVEKYGRFRQVTDDILICRMRIAWWISKATHTHTHTHTQNSKYFPFPQQ